MSFVLKDTLNRLQSYNESPSPIISLYLSLTESKDALLQNFSMLVEKGLSDEQKSDFSHNISYLYGYLEKDVQNKKNKGLALFSGGDNLFEVIRTRFPLPSLIAIDHSPYLDPIYKELSDYERYLVILTDRQKAKFITLFLGELEDQTELKESTVPQKVKGRNASERVKKVDRHIKDHLHRHFDFVSDKVSEFIKNKYITGVVVGGHKEVLHLFENHLPKSLQKKIIGEIQTEPDAPMNTILEKSKKIIADVHKTFHPPNTAISL